MSHHKTVLLWISLGAVLGASLCTGRAAQSDYAVTQEFLLRQNKTASTETLQLLTDKRLSKSLQEELWGHGDWNLSLSPNSPIFKVFSLRRPTDSRLRIINSVGETAAEYNLKVPLAKLEAWNAASGNGQVFLLTRDYTAGFGSYSGLVTTLLMVSDSAFHEVEAWNPESHREQPIWLLDSLKSMWRISHREERPEILSVSCHPKSGGKFAIDYVRYSLDGERWIERRREVEGIWESDDTFPENSAFP